jgi:hypothetical protein
MRSAVLEALAFAEPVAELPRVRTSAEWVQYFAPTASAGYRCRGTRRTTSPPPNSKR